MEDFNRSSGWYYEEHFLTKEALGTYFHGHPFAEELSTGGAAMKCIFASPTATNAELESGPRLVRTSHFISLAANDELSRSARHTLCYFPEAQFVIVNSSIAPDELQEVCKLNKIIDVCIYGPESSRTKELIKELNRLQREWPQKRVWFTSTSRIFYD